MEKFTFLNWRVLHLQLNALNPKKKVIFKKKIYENIQNLMPNYQGNLKLCKN